jgi:tRNA modification GTPase
LNLHRPLYGRFGRTVRDDVVLIARGNPSHPQVEISCHGGEAVVGALLADLTEAGVRLVDWREFLRRSGRSEIAVEIADALSQAKTAKTTGILLDQMQVLEESIDRALLSADREAAARMLQWSTLGMHLVRPWNVLLFGKANVGKSSLLNALAGYERAIVADVAGTTRDLLCAPLAIDGWLFDVYDGAGFHEEARPLERQGQERLRERLSQMDLKIQVLDLSTPLEPIDEQLTLEFKPDLLVGMKADLPSPWPIHAKENLKLCCSTVDGQGTMELARAIATTLIPAAPASGEPVPFTARQAALLHSVIE